MQDELQKAERELTDAMQAVARCAQEIAAEAKDVPGGHLVEREDMQELRELIREWTLASNLYMSTVAKISREEAPKPESTEP